MIVFLHQRRVVLLPHDLMSRNHNLHSANIEDVLPHFLVPATLIRVIVSVVRLLRLATRRNTKVAFGIRNAVRRAVCTILRMMRVSRLLLVFVLITLLSLAVLTVLRIS